MELEKKFVYRVEDNDTWEIIYTKFNTSKQNILRNNNDIPLYVGELIEITVNDYITHIVKPMETLKNIAEKYKITVEELKKENDINTDKLFIGQILKIQTKKAL